MQMHLDSSSFRSVVGGHVLSLFNLVIIMVNRAKRITKKNILGLEMRLRLKPRSQAPVIINQSAVVEEVALVVVAPCELPSLIGVVA